MEDEEKKKLIEKYKEKIKDYQNEDKIWEETNKLLGPKKYISKLDLRKVSKIVLSIVFIWRIVQKVFTYVLVFFNFIKKILKKFIKKG